MRDAPDDAPGAIADGELAKAGERPAERCPRLRIALEQEQLLQRPAERLRIRPVQGDEVGEGRLGEPDDGALGLRVPPA